ncbi:MAG: SafA/ExsA family spore coat assembly protein [Firmicutes bacterium]|nr:SafA/ExsA family spore coat assembly protein [Bacillota bacterium]
MPRFCQNGQTYTVKSGDTLYLIARQYNIPLQSLINANPQISDPNLIYPGQVICIPAAPEPGVCPGGISYTIRPGDTMYRIAQRYGVSLTALINANPQISNPNLIYPGQVICIPRQTGPVVCPGGMVYTVKPGDTMFEIARMYGISLADLIAANPQISDPNLIYPGQMICVPRTVVSPEPGTEPMPMPAPPAPEMPAPPCYHGIMPPVCPIPVYMIPWEECPYRTKKRRKECRDYKEHHKRKEHHRCHN